MVGSRYLGSVVADVRDREWEPAVDRQKKCPFLLRLFYSFDQHFTTLDYRRLQYPKNEIQIYTWMDATLEEIVRHVRRHNRKLVRSGTVLDFELITQSDGPPRFRSIKIGSITIGQEDLDKKKTLSSFQFRVGDFMDVNIILPKK